MFIQELPRNLEEIDSTRVFPHVFPTFKDHDHAADGNEGS